MFRPIILSLLVFSLSACTSLFGIDSVFRDRSGDYLRADDMPQIEVPEDLDSDTLGVAFPVPEVTEYQLGDQFQTPRPEQLAVEPVGQVRIQSLAGESWILVPASPGEVWPQLRRFLTNNRIPTLSTDAGNGVIETDWVSDDGDDSLAYQYRFRLEQGVQLNTTEIVVDVRQMQVNEPDRSPPAWDSPDAINPDQEAAMRLQLAEALADEESGGTASLLGQSIGAAAKVEVVTPRASDPYILLHLSYERSWASVEYALGSEWFGIDSSDREAGVFDIQLFTEPAQPSSWLGRLFGGGRSTSTAYRVQLQRVGEAVEVRVTTPEGASLPQREAFEVLTLLRSNLA